MEFSRLTASSFHFLQVNWAPQGNHAIMGTGQTEHLLSARHYEGRHKNNKFPSPRNNVFMDETEPRPAKSQETLGAWILSSFPNREEVRRKKHKQHPLPEGGKKEPSQVLPGRGGGVMEQLSPHSKHDCYGQENTQFPQKDLSLRCCPPNRAQEGPTQTSPREGDPMTPQAWALWPL